MRSSRTLFDLSDLNPFGNPTTSIDEDFDEVTGLPRSIADSLMGVPDLASGRMGIPNLRKRKRRYAWDENPDPMDEEMDVPPGVPAPAPGAGATIPLGGSYDSQSIGPYDSGASSYPSYDSQSVTPQQQAPQQPQQPQKEKGGWRNKISLRGIAGALGDGLVGASTPNIAYGGGQDIIRAGAGGWGAHQSRIEKKRQLEAEAERRRIALEDRKMKIEYDTARAKREEAKAVLDAAAAERAAAAAKRAEEREERLTKAAETKDKYAHVHVTEKGAYDMETKEFKPFTDASGAMSPLGKDYNDLLAIYKKTGNEAYNPNSDANQKLLKDKHLSAKKDMNRTAADILLDPNATPQEKALAEKYEEAEFNKKKTLAYISRQQQQGIFNPAAFTAVSAAYSVAEARRAAGMAEANRRLEHANDQADKGDESLAPARREEAKKIFNAEKARLDSVYVNETEAATERSRQIGTEIPKTGYVPPTPEAAPSAGPKVPDAVDNRTGEVKRWDGTQWVTIKPPRR